MGGSENELFNLNFGGGMLTRDIDFNAPESGGRAPCCPHHPTGSCSTPAAAASSGGGSLPSYATGGSKVSTVASLTQRFGGKNAVKGQNVESRELEDAAKQVFSVFKNKFKF